MFRCLFGSPKKPKPQRREEVTAAAPTSAAQTASAPDEQTAADVAAQEDVILAMALSRSVEDRGGVVHDPVTQNLDIRFADESLDRQDDVDTDPTNVAQMRAIDRLTEILLHCEQTGEQFMDPEFIPGPRVLYANGECRRRDASNLAIVRHFGGQEGEINWRTSSEILQRPDDLQMEFASTQEMMATVHQFARCVEWRVFQADPCPTDISQGGLGNCWFCGSLAAVAERPALIRALFIDEHSRNDMACWPSVVQEEISCGCLFLEKAYSKLRRTYESIEGGTPAEGLRLFTGWPSIVQELQAQQNPRAEDIDPANGLRTQAFCPYVDDDLLWTRLVSACDTGLIMCGSCGHVEGITEEMYRGVGLSPSHCYSIVRVATALQGNLRLLKLRNPWGTGRKWNGRFSDTDTDHWTPEIRTEVGADDLGAEGLFWMPVEEIRRYFTSITICPYREGWAEARRTDLFPSMATSGLQPAFVLSSDIACEPLLSLMQPEERASLTMMTGDVGLAIFRLPAGALNVPGGRKHFDSIKGFELADAVKRKVQDTLLCDCFMKKDVGREPRPILVVPLCLNQRSSPQSPGVDKPFTFACYSPHPIILRSVKISVEAHRDALVAHVKRVGQSSFIPRGSKFGKLWQSGDAGLTVVVENYSTSDVLLFESRLTDIFNMTISRGMEANAHGEQYVATRDTIPPMHGMIIFVAAAMPAGHTFRFSPLNCEISQSAVDIHEPPLALPVDTLHTPFFLEQ